MSEKETKKEKKSRVKWIVMTIFILSVLTTSYFIISNSKIRNAVDEKIVEVMGCPIAGTYQLEFDDLILDMSITKDYKVIGNINRKSLIGNVTNNVVNAKTSEYIVELQLTPQVSRIHIVGTIKAINPNLWQKYIGSSVWNVDVMAPWQ